MSSLVLAFFLIRFQTSMVNNVEALLNIEVRSLIKAAIITAIIMPRSPLNSQRKKLAIHAHENVLMLNNDFKN